MEWWVNESLKNCFQSQKMSTKLLDSSKNSSLCSLTNFVYDILSAVLSFQKMLKFGLRLWDGKHLTQWFTTTPLEAKIFLNF